MADKQEIFRNDSKQIVDMLYEGGLFAKKIKRSDMDVLENYICDMMDSRFESYKKMEKLLEDIENTQ